VIIGLTLDSSYSGGGCHLSNTTSDTNYS
jgi:hypothetical protein